jgi:TPP-dependent 2-oxoacid decarboxylase
LEACVADVIARLQDSTKPVVVAGRGMRASDQTLHSFATMAEIAGCAVACQPDAKGLFDESHPLFIGTYWGLCSTPLAAETVESADLLLLAGCVLTDYNTAGWTANIHLNRCIIAGAKGVSVCGKQYSNVRLGDFLDGLAKRVMRRDKSAVNYRRFVIDQVPSPVAVSSSATESPPTAPLTHRALREALQHHISASSEIMVDVGDSWFLGQELRLPSGARYHSQMMYGATGWSLGASLGLVLGSDARREVLVLIGDGALQMSFQELSTLIRHDLAVTVVCINNSGYVTDRCILDGMVLNLCTQHNIILGC